MPSQEELLPVISVIVLGLMLLTIVLAVKHRISITKSRKAKLSKSLFQKGEETLDSLIDKSIFPKIVPNKADKQLREAFRRCSFNHISKRTTLMVALAVAKRSDYEEVTLAWLRNINENLATTAMELQSKGILNGSITGMEDGTIKLKPV